MVASRHFFSDYLLKTPTSKEKHHLQGISLENVINKFATLSSPNNKNIVAGAKRFVCSNMVTIDSIMALKDNLKFEYIHNNQLLGQSTGKVFIFKMSVDLAGSGADFVQWMQAGRNMEHS
jgi:hypothetical protein